MKKLMVFCALAACLATSTANTMFFGFGGYFPFARPRPHAVIVAHPAPMYRGHRFVRRRHYYNVPVCAPVYVAPRFTPSVWFSWNLF